MSRFFSRISSHSMPLDYDDILDFIGFRTDCRNPVYAPVQMVLPLKAQNAWYWGYMKGWWDLPGHGWTWNNGYYNDISDHYPVMADFYFWSGTSVATTISQTITPFVTAEFEQVFLMTTDEIAARREFCSFFSFLFCKFAKSHIYFEWIRLCWIFSSMKDDFRLWSYFMQNNTSIGKAKKYGDFCTTTLNGFFFVFLIHFRLLFFFYLWHW